MQWFLQSSLSIDWIASQQNREKRNGILKAGGVIICHCFIHLWKWKESKVCHRFVVQLRSTAIRLQLLHSCSSVLHYLPNAMTPKCWVASTIITIARIQWRAINGQRDRFRINIGIQQKSFVTRWNRFRGQISCRSYATRSTRLLFRHTRPQQYAELLFQSFNDIQSTRRHHHRLPFKSIKATRFRGYLPLQSF